MPTTTQSSAWRLPACRAAGAHQQRQWAARQTRVPRPSLSAPCCTTTAPRPNSSRCSCARRRLPQLQAVMLLSLPQRSDYRRCCNLILNMVFGCGGAAHGVLPCTPTPRTPSVGYNVNNPASRKLCCERERSYASIPVPPRPSACSKRPARQRRPPAHPHLRPFETIQHIQSCFDVLKAIT